MKKKKIDPIELAKRIYGKWEFPNLPKEDERILAEFAIKRKQAEKTDI